MLPMINPQRIIKTLLIFAIISFLINFGITTWRVMNDIPFPQWTIDSNIPDFTNLTLLFTAFKSIALVVAMILFYRFISYSFGSSPFLKQNLKLLGRVGIVLFITWILDLSPKGIHLYEIFNYYTDQISRQDLFMILYQHITHIFINPYFLFGCLTFIFRGIFQHGINLKNEQALTI